ncbi:unnamed protein product [Sphagnum compactum]
MGSGASNFTRAQNSFSSKSTAEDVTANIDLHGKTILITGATAGIGKETARVLAKRGGHIIIAVRNLKKGEAVKEEILKETPSAPFDVLELDVSSLASVRKFAEDFKSRDFPISILINNAGALFGKFELSQDGLEKTFATNHMATAEKSGEEGRIVNLASDAHKLVGKKGIPYDKLNDAKRTLKESNKVTKPAQNMDMAAALWKFSEDFVSTH